jgi:hypothetical protein
VNAQRGEKALKLDSQADEMQHNARLAIGALVVFVAVCSSRR